jgi:hypothetical protein
MLRAGFSALRKWIDLLSIESSLNGKRDKIAEAEEGIIEAGCRGRENPGL